MVLFSRVFLEDYKVVAFSLIRFDRIRYSLILPNVFDEQTIIMFS